MNKLFTTLLLLLGVQLALAGSDRAVAAPSSCLGPYVTVQEKTVTVLPTGTDDTVNLQCAIDLGVTLGPGTTIQLTQGIFTTAQLVVKDLRGAIRGMGQEATIIHNPATPVPIDRPDCAAAGSDCFIDSPPSATNRYPSLISILGRDVVLSDFQIEILGSQSTARWHTPWGIDAALLSNVVQFLGSDSTLSVERVFFSSGGASYDAEQNVFAGQAVTGLDMWSFSRPWFVTNSTLRVDNCIFHGIGGLYTYNLDLSQAFIANNHFEVSGDGAAAWFISDVRRSQLQGLHNEMKALGTGAADIFVWAGNIGTGVESSYLLFANNILTGNTGIFLQPGIFEDVKCQAVNNNVTNVSVPYVFDTTTPCKVLGQ